jgi:hypothetical protein
MNKFFQYINEVLESLDIISSIDSTSKHTQSSPKNFSKKNYLEEK